MSDVLLGGVQGCAYGLAGLLLGFGSFRSHFSVVTDASVKEVPLAIACNVLYVGV